MRPRSISSPPLLFVFFRSVSHRHCSNDTYFYAAFLSRHRFRARFRTLSPRATSIIILGIAGTRNAALYARSTLDNRYRVTSWPTFHRTRSYIFSSISSTNDNTRTQVEKKKHSYERTKTLNRSLSLTLSFSYSIFLVLVESTRRLARNNVETILIDTTYKSSNT